MFATVAGHTLRDDKRNDCVRKGLSMFPLMKKIIKYHIKYKDHVNRRQMVNVVKNAWGGVQ